MSHSPLIRLPYALERAAPPFEDQDVKYPESLVRYFLEKYTKPGDKVFDPFTGLGTTLFVAEEMGRVPFGVEAQEDRHEWVAGQLAHWQNLRRGDSGRLARQGFPKMDFSMTSPPYMPKDEAWNPLYGGDPAHAGYEAYLRRMRHIYRQVAGLMKRGAFVVVQADNLAGRAYTPLVRDIGRMVEASLRLDAEIIVAWDNAKPDYPHTHCLVFRKV